MYKNYIKPILDFIIALLALPFLLLIILIIGICIKLEDGGSIFYIAERRGKNGKPFKMYKFRSMKENAPQIRNADGSTYNSKDDSRLTKVGRFIRETSIDELPQILNILFGHMSIVGNRPTLYSGKKFAKDSVQMRRNQLKPGITGYAQAYVRNSVSVEKRYEYDIKYIEEVSFILDLKIIIKTITVIWQKKDIYIKEQNL
jgi:undecaprenyl phosphate N,N'-diacetylbacillosamine 1-phosphate transferase